MKTRKLTAAVLSALCCALAFTGCGGTTDSERPELSEPGIVTPERPTPPDVTPPEEDKKPLDRTDIYIDDADDKPILPPASFDDSEKYDYSNVTYTNRLGSFEKNGETYKAMIPTADIALHYGVPFAYGTISCTVRSNNLVDTGLIFGATPAPDGAFNESGMVYYFYFLGMGGSAYLGKWDGPKNKWSALVVKQLGAVNANKDYELKVVLKGNYMVCYMDGEIMFGFKDEDFSGGTGFGLRVTAHPDVNPQSSAVGVTISDMTVTSEYDYRTDKQ